MHENDENIEKNEEDEMILHAKNLNISIKDIKLKKEAFDILNNIKKFKNIDLATMSLHDKILNIEEVVYKIIHKLRSKNDNNILEDNISKDWNIIIMKSWENFSNINLKPLLYNSKCTNTFCLIADKLFLDIKKLDCKIQILSEYKFENIIEESYVKSIIILQSGYKQILEEQINLIYDKYEQDTFYTQMLKHSQKIPTFTYYRILRMHELLLQEEKMKEKKIEEKKIEENKEKVDEEKIKKINNVSNMNKLNMSPELLIKLAHMNSLNLDKTTVGLATFSRLRNIYNFNNLQINKKSKYDSNAYKHQYGIQQNITEEELLERKLKVSTHDLDQKKLLFDLVHNKVPFHYKNTFSEEEQEKMHEEYIINKKTYNNRYNFDKDNNKSMFDYVLTKTFMKEEKRTPSGREYTGKGHLPPVKMNMIRYQSNPNTYFDLSKPNKEMKDEAIREFNYNEHDRVTVSQEGINTVLDMIGKNKDPEMLMKNATHLNFELKSKLSEVVKLKSNNSIVERLRFMYNKDKNHSWLRKTITDTDLYWKIRKKSVINEYLKSETISDSKELNDIRKEVGDFREGGMAKKSFNMYTRQKILGDIKGLEKSRLISSMIVCTATVGVFTGLAIQLKSGIVDAQSELTGQMDTVLNDVMKSDEMKRISEAFEKGEEQYNEKYDEWKTWKNWDAVNWWNFFKRDRDFGHEAAPHDKPLNNDYDSSILI